MYRFFLSKSTTKLQKQHALYYRQCKYASTSPLAQYNQLIESNLIQNDDHQLEILSHFDKLHHDILKFDKSQHCFALIFKATNDKIRLNCSLSKPLTGAIAFNPRPSEANNVLLSCMVDLDFVREVR